LLEAEFWEVEIKQCV